MADANAVIRNLAQKLAQLHIDLAIAEVEAQEAQPVIIPAEEEDADTE